MNYRFIFNKGRNIIAAILFLLVNLSIYAQAPIDICDNNEYRKWWDVMKYDIYIDFDLKNKSINGTNIISATAIAESQSILQIDLLSPLSISKIELWNSKTSIWEPIPFNIFENYTLAMIPYAPYGRGDTFSMKISYHGKPKVAKNAPWDGGVVFSKDKKNRHFVGVACQGLGASVFFPHKDMLSDEPDFGISMTLAVPPDYTAIGNGQIVNTVVNDKTKKKEYTYRVKNPINNYSISFYIGKYKSYKEKIKTESGTLPFIFNYLDYNNVIATPLISAIPKMVAAMEYWCGPYPFPQDGINFVEAPYLGMEHQSAIAYGNGYANGYKGIDRSGSGVGMLFDFIAIHELAHEWWGNNVSTANPCDMWINEGFTTYMESLYVEYVYGKEEAKTYRIGKQRLIKNNTPIRGECSQCKSGSGDAYDKGGAMVHNLRLIMNNDSLFRVMLRDINKKFAHKVIHGDQLISFIKPYYAIDIQPTIKQFIDYIEVPKFSYDIEGNNLKYQWKDCQETFNMPLKVIINNKAVWLSPTVHQQEYTFEEKIKSISIDEDWYINRSN